MDKIHINYDTIQWRELTDRDNFIVDIKYASTDNFMDQQIYPCGRCMVRPIVYTRLISINTSLINQGYRLKLLDCYRPKTSQQKLWDIKPDKRYVAPPEKGSMHSRGTAVDVTLVTLDGHEVDMGTPYDFFGRAAWPSTRTFNDSIVAHRSILQAAFLKAGFKQARSEWWHFSLPGIGAQMSDWEWPCN